MSKGIWVATIEPGDRCSCRSCGEIFTAGRVVECPKCKSKAIRKLGK